ncbi:GFA family protein [Sphingosinicella terrae]|uniref:GFA family protein n=1 Tax=Sphingosinicella terrae TaxID=2172047 RepID=UPI000E0DDF59|nr:GFA family protein [Sphingosinicella terrae]
MKKTHQGSCHCGAVRFEVDVDLDAGTSRCNCSFCSKDRSWGTLAKPEDFRLVSGANSLSDYQFGTFSGHHRFCSRCGVHVFGEGEVEALGGAFVSIQVATLDDLGQAELAALPILYQDGRNDNWWNVPEETRHL